MDVATYYSVAIAAGLLLLALSFLLPAPSAATTSRIISVVAFALAVMFALLH